MQDMLLEVVGVRSSMELGAAQIGLGSVVRLAQAKDVRLVTTSPLPVQIDGEPSLMPAGEVRIEFKEQAVVLKKGESRKDAIPQEVLDWAHKEELIDDEVHTAMVKELARRIHAVE